MVCDSSVTLISHLPLPLPWPLSAWPTGLCSSTPGAFIAELFVTKADSSSQEMCWAVVLLWETAEALSVPTWKSLSEADCTVVFQTGACSHYPSLTYSDDAHVGSHNAERIKALEVFTSPIMDVLSVAGYSHCLQRN